MTATEAAAADVQAHMHPADLAENRAFTPDSGAKSARAGATQARVIPLRKDLRQEDRPGDPQESRRASGQARGGLAEEFAAGVKVAREGAANSELAREPMTVLQALEHLAPAKGEASNKSIWLAMTLAGVLRLFWVSVGHLIAAGGATRIRATVVSAVLTAALVASWALQHAS